MSPPPMPRLSPGVRRTNARPSLSPACRTTSSGWPLSATPRTTSSASWRSAARRDPAAKGGEAVVNRHGLEQVVAGAGGEGALAHFRALVGGHHDDPQGADRFPGFARADAPDDLQPVH